ncbi:MAG: 6-carboxytetrahydropterin synthase [Bacteroidota bacterium]|nr:6-carboxytetrahydropterin synthase [Bacteroidota bacterium]
MVFVTRKERFNAAHRLFRAEWSDEKNLEVFGKCSNPNWHGHNYELYVTVKGEADPLTGFVMDLKILSTIIRTRVTDKLDHRNINLDVDFMIGKIPSTEILAIAIWEQIERPILASGCHLHCVKLFETENNFVEYYGNQKLPDELR